MNNQSHHLITGGEDPFLPALLDGINRAKHIHMAVAFIRQSGLSLIHVALKEALERAAEVRILAGDYLNVTEPEALRHLLLLKEMGADVRIFQSRGSNSFHLKAYIFLWRESDEQAGIAFVGSSNITRTALQDGLEWNLGVDCRENTLRFKEITQKFTVLFNAPSTTPLTHGWIDDYQKKIDPLSKQVSFDPVDLEILPPPEPYPLQQEALQALVDTRNAGYRRGLVVMATGLGKTWLAAFDSLQIDCHRVLFVAHREEILAQAEETFVRTRPNARVGRYTGKTQELDVDMLFASIQTLGKERHLANFAPDHFDYVVVDEFHHAAASTYRRLLNRFHPKFLIGLTATPDRTDRSDILSFCDNNLVFTRDLNHGVEAGLLCPFHYYGIGDETVQYDEIPWRNGRFDPDQLVNQLATRGRAKHALDVWKKYRQDRTLAFCASKRHADFMARYFTTHGISAVSVYSDSEVRRNEALRGLEQGEVDIIFSVDLFNEGLDIPAIDTVLMLRPTESKILFLQQLGRGLRLSVDTAKEKLVVVDFIGNHISFFRKPEALFKIDTTNDARRTFLDNYADGHLPLPPGCFVNYDVQAIDFMIRLTHGHADTEVDRYRSLRAAMGRRPTLSEFYSAGGTVGAIRHEHGNWFRFVDRENDLTTIEKECIQRFIPFFSELETTKLTKSFKMILIEALLELDGFRYCPEAADLSVKSYGILRRRRALLPDLPEAYHHQEILTPMLAESWHRYWSTNPIAAWIGGFRRSGKIYFEMAGDRFAFKGQIPPELWDSFEYLVQEIVDFRYVQYEARPGNKDVEPTDISVFSTPSGVEIPYFTDLAIACGYFRHSTHEDEHLEYRFIPSNYGVREPSHHFIAQATGDSMDGGEKPIRSGDFLLLRATQMEEKGVERDNRVVVIEKRDGGDQYLLRSTSIWEDGRIELVAQNPAYESMILNDDMTIVGDLVSVVNPLDLHLHRPIPREKIPVLVGLVFNTGLWQSGHVCPADTDDQFLFVTLNKQGIAQEHQYHDYFIDEKTFHWQSQNRTSPDNMKGRAICHPERDGHSVHLFVRKNKLEKGKGAPFIYCGKLIYKSHEGKEPMNVTWHLESSLVTELLQYFGPKSR